MLEESELQAHGFSRGWLTVEPFGRICRNHPEAEAHQAKLAEMARKDAEDRESAARLKQATDNLNKIMFVSQLRTLAAMRNVPVELPIMAFGHRIPQSIREEVLKEVREKGPLTEEEMNQSIAMAAVMIQKGLAKPVDFV